jgi:hypothetical protein
MDIELVRQESAIIVPIVYFKKCLTKLGIFLEF